MQSEPTGKGARRLLWVLVIGIVVLNLLIFLATLRKDSGEAAVPNGVGTEMRPRTNAP